MATAHGGQVVATMAFVEALGATSDITVRPLGRYALRGLSEPTAIVQLDRDGATAAFPALRAEPAG
jgi:class 3 adenylate cyclase